ncbi:MAG: hypothetical protein ACYCSO_04640 [Cuniculiplasma sp.]
MPEINAKFIAVIIVAAVIIGTGLSFFHETYNAKPYEKIKIPPLFSNEERMFSFSQKGSSFSPIGNSSITLKGYVTIKNGGALNGPISIYDFPWVVHTNLVNGFYSVTLLQYGAFTIGYKASGYNTGFSKFTILSGSTQWANVTVTRATFYTISGETLNLSHSSVPLVNLSFPSFFGVYNGSSNINAKYNITLQNGTYVAFTIKQNYYQTPKPEFFNVTGKGITGLNFLMNRTKNASYFVSGYVHNQLGNPVGGVKVTSYSILNGTPFSSSVTDSHGLYTVLAPPGYDYLETPFTSAYMPAKTGGFKVNSTVTNRDITLQAIDPFVAFHSTKVENGTKPLPSFMLPKARAFLSRNLTSTGYSKGFYSSGSIGIQLKNIFYPSSPQNSNLMKTFTIMVMGDFNGSIYYTQSIVGGTGLVSIPMHYQGSYPLLIYVPGFNLSDYKFNYKANNSSGPFAHINLTPLPGQYFTVNGQALNLINSAPQLYPNVTLWENGLLVNESIEQSNKGFFSFYYFFDTQQKYNITLTLNISQAGFKNYILSKQIGTSTINRFRNISNIKAEMVPLSTIGNGFNNIYLNIPGYSKHTIQNKLLNGVSSNKYNFGKQENVLQLNTKSNGDQFVAYTELNGVLYSRVVNPVNGSITLNTTFTTFLNITVIGQFSKSFNIEFTPSFKHIKSVSLITRRTSDVNITMVNMLNYTVDKRFGKQYGVNFDHHVPWGNLFINSSSSAIPMKALDHGNYHANTSVIFQLPQGNYNFSFTGSSFVTGNLRFTKNNITNTRENLNVSEYGFVIPIKSKVSLTYTLKILANGKQNTIFQGNYNYVTASSGIVLDLFPENVNGNSLGGMYYEINVDKSYFNSPTFSITKNKPYDIQYINVSSKQITATFDETGSSSANGTYLWNNSVELGSQSGIIKNITVKTNNGQIYNLTKYSTLVIDNKNIETLSANGKEFNYLNYSFTSGGHLNMRIYLGGKILTTYTFFNVYFGILNVNYTNQNGVE